MGYWNADGNTKGRSYHHTAPINSLYGLHEALLMVHEEGIENTWERHQANHEQLVNGLTDLGLKMFVNESDRLPQLNTVEIPQGIVDSEIRDRLLRDFELEIGGGLGDLTGKVWRIGLMGEASRTENVRTCLSSLKKVLDQGSVSIMA